jgi:hypothetical protein
MKHQHSDHESFAKEPEAAYSVETISIHEAKTNLHKDPFDYMLLTQAITCPCA